MGAGLILIHSFKCVRGTSDHQLGSGNQWCSILRPGKQRRLNGPAEFRDGVEHRKTDAKCSGDDGADKNFHRQIFREGAHAVHAATTILSIPSAERQIMASGLPPGLRYSLRSIAKKKSVPRDPYPRTIKTD